MQKISWGVPNRLTRWPSSILIVSEKTSSVCPLLCFYRIAEYWLSYCPTDEVLWVAGGSSCTRHPTSVNARSRAAAQSKWQTTVELVWQAAIKLVIYWFDPPKEASFLVSLGGSYQYMTSTRLFRWTFFCQSRSVSNSQFDKGVLFPCFNTCCPWAIAASEPGCGKSVSVCADDITIILTGMKHLRCVGEGIKYYETVVGAKVNHEKSVGLQLGTWSGKSMLPDKIVGSWAEGPIKLLAI